MPDLVANVLKFATFGVTCEVVFTASTDAWAKLRNKKRVNAALYGYSYIWMIPIYASIAFLGPVVIEPLQGYPLLARLLIYTAVIFMVEYATGWLICKITGRCPWHYTEGWHVHHYIRLDFTPAWMLFSCIVEFLYFAY